MTLLNIFDEMVKNEKILQDQNQDLQMLIKMTNLLLESSKRKNQDYDSKLKEAGKKIFDLEQIVRTLRIQLEEERETNADLDIENLKLKKKIKVLESSLETVNNNFYGDDETEKLLMSVTDSSLDSIDDATLLGEELCLSDFKLLGESTMNSSPLASNLSAMPMSTSTPAIYVGDCPINESTKLPFNTGTYTKKGSSGTYTKKGSSGTYTKNRRRSKSVDYKVGEKTIIAPSVCELCMARPRNVEDSFTLPWCPHSRTSVSINVTPVRSLLMRDGCTPTVTKTVTKPILKKTQQLRPLPRKNCK